MFVDLRRWMTTKAVAKYRPLISRALNNMSSDQWEDAVKAFQEIEDLLNAEMDRRIDNVQRLS
jgi:hypothetical protein